MSEEEIDEVELPEEEGSEEDIDIVEIEDQVSWTKSDYATTEWHENGGYSFDVKEINGKKYLDPEEITRRTPEGKGATSFLITEKDALRIYKEKYPPISIYVDATKVIDDLINLNPEIVTSDNPFPHNASEEKIFARVILEISNIWNNKYRPNQRKPNTKSMPKRTGISWTTLKGYLHVGEIAGLWVPALRGVATRKPKELTPDDKVAMKDYDDWLIQKPIQDWVTSGKGTATYDKNQKSLFMAMKLMNISPDALVRLARQPNPKAVKDIGDLMERDTFKDLRSEENILPKTAMVTRKGKAWQLPKGLYTGDKHTRGAWYWGKYGLQGKPKVWYYKTKDADPNEYKNKKWSLRDWAIAPDAPALLGKNQKVTWKNEQGKQKSATVFKGSARELTQESIKAKQENVLYNLVGVLRQFLEVHGMAFGDMDEDSIWSQIVNPPTSATIHMDIDQLEDMKECLKKGKDEGTMEFDDYHSLNTPKEDKRKFKSVEEAKSYWNDAYLYFLLSLELGFRTEEAFTIVGEETQEVEATNKAGKSGIIVWKNGDMKLQIYTRKGASGSKGQRIHGGFILSEETKELVLKRQNEIKEGMKQKTQKEADKFGVQLEYQNQKYVENSLIGASGRYTELGTLDLPATLQKGDDRKLGTVKSKVYNRDKIMAILRNCYHSIGLKEDYFYDHTFHSLRHMFAQYWLDLSDYNYSFVAKLGHWKTESVVKNVYGKDLGSRIMSQMRGFVATRDGKFDPFQKLREKQQDAEREMPESERRALETGYSEEDLMKIKDLKLRENVYYNGGEYWDTRISIDRPTDESLIIQYDKGTDLGFIDKSPKNPMKKFILFKKEKGKDSTKTEEKPTPSPEIDTE